MAAPAEAPLVAGRSRAARAVWVAVGCVSVGLGTIGIVVPGLPTTGFFVLAAWAFSKSSPRLERWVLDRPGVGPLVRDYRDGLGMPRRAKVAAITMLVVSCGLSAGLGVDRLVVRLAILAAGAVGIAWILWRVPTRETVVARRAAAA
ncbi:MAG TPA: YbaN family protein [Iamia sp.]|nr:YbaN family protein [Iamia sp.]